MWRSGPWEVAPHPTGQTNGQKLVKKHENWSDSDVVKAFWAIPKPDSTKKGQGTSWNHLGALKQEGQIQNLGFWGLGGEGGFVLVFFRVFPLKGAYVVCMDPVDPAQTPDPRPLKGRS